MTNQDFANQLIKWYQHHKRELPWRETRDPYKIWLSEIILQQTRVNQGLPYYLKFVEQYPSVFDLAKAKEDEVLRLWQGLGYYSRARNLHSCAKMVVDKYSGVFPNTYNELLKLKGVGSYTAAAIASFAFDEPNAVVDGNVYRVLSRVFGIYDDIASNQGVKAFAELANQLIDTEHPADYNQAIMEFGALQCSPKTPTCGLCPISEQCHAHNHNTQLKLPVKSKKVKVRTRHFHYFILKQDDKIYMRQRGPKDVWQGLYDFYLIELDREVNTEDVLTRLPQKFLDQNILEDESKIFKHVLTHQRIFATFYQFNVKSKGSVLDLASSENLKAYNTNQIKELPKPTLINNFLVENIF